MVDRVALESSRLHFVQEFQRKPPQSLLRLAIADNEGNSAAAAGPSVVLYPRAGSFEAQLAVAPSIYIDKQRAVRLSINAGDQDVEQLDFRLKSASAGLRLYIGDTSDISGSAGTMDLSTAGSIKLVKVLSHTQIVLHIPYSLENSLREISVRMEASYRTHNEPFIFHRNTSLPVQLPLDVNVSDNFKRSAVFSKFSVRTMNSLPLLVWGVDLRESAIWNLKAMAYTSPMTVFEKQPACISYRLSRQANSDDRTFSQKGAALTLNVSYQCLDTIVTRTLTSFFEKALADSPFSKFQRLLTPYLQDVIPDQMLGPLALEQAVLLSETPIPSYASICWEPATQSLSPSTRAALLKWLSAWHVEHPTLYLDLHTPPSAFDLHRLTMSVDVPSLDILHTASVRLPNLTRASTHLPPLVYVGQPLRAEVRICHTRKWKSPSTSKPLLPSTTEGEGDEASGDSSEKKLQFVYNVAENLDQWLIGGRKRATFTAEEDEVVGFELVLVPLITGVLRIPSLDVQIAGNADAGGGGSIEGLSCETDCTSAAQSVMVIKDGRESSVTILDGQTNMASMATGMERASTDTRISRVAG